MSAQPARAYVVDTRELLNQPLKSADRDHPGSLALTSVAAANNRVFVGSLSRGVLEIANGAAKETQTRPATYFVNALELDQDAKLWAGARAKKEEPGLFTGNDPPSLKRQESPTGPVMALKLIADEMWVGTDGRGVFRISKAKTQRFTFDGTAGGLRSDHVYAIFADREGVIWFGTDRGVCRSIHTRRASSQSATTPIQTLSDRFSSQAAAEHRRHESRALRLRRPNCHLESGAGSRPQHHLRDRGRQIAATPRGCGEWFLHCAKTNRAVGRPGVHSSRSRFGKRRRGRKRARGHAVSRRDLLRDLLVAASIASTAAAQVLVGPTAMGVLAKF